MSNILKNYKYLGYLGFLSRFERRTIEMVHEVAMVRLHSYTDKADDIME